MPSATTLKINMNEYNCDPCTRLQKKNTSLQWCVFCQELLCNDCYNYHTALTATKNHSFLTVEQYKSYLPILKSVQTVCPTHPEKDYEYFCKDHNCPCCILCKRKEHTGCKDVEKIEEALADIDLKGNFTKLKTEISKSVRNLKRLSENRDENISKLQEQKERLWADLKATRECIEHALNEFEADIKSVIERNFNKETDNILTQRNELSVHISDFEKRLDLIQSISEFDFVPNMFLFLLDGNTKNQLHQISDAVENLIESLKDVKSECNVSVEINRKNMNIKMINTIEFSKITSVEIINFKGEDRDDNDQSEITSSSTIEDDLVLNIAANVSPALVLSTGEKSFKLTSHFTLHSPGSNTVTSNRFIKALSNDRILIGGKSDRNMTVYDRSGKILGEIKMQFPTTSVAVINNNTIAAAAHKAVVFVDMNTYKFSDLIVMRDNCVGLAFVHNNLIVNCVTKGLSIMSIAGNIAKKFENLKGEMQIIELENKIVALVKTNSPAVERVNIATLSKLSDIDMGFIGRRSLTNCMGNVLISTLEQNKVCAIKIGSKKFDFDTILDAHDGINEPTCIDFDMKSKELLLINHGGKSVYIFKMQVDKL